MNFTASPYYRFLKKQKKCLFRHHERSRCFVLKFVLLKKLFALIFSIPAANWSPSLCHRHTQVHGIMKVQLKHGTKSIQNYAKYFMSNILKHIYLLCTIHLP